MKGAQHNKNYPYMYSYYSGSGLMELVNVSRIPVMTLDVGIDISPFMVSDIFSLAQNMFEKGYNSALGDMSPKDNNE